MKSSDNVMIWMFMRRMRKALAHWQLIEYSKIRREYFSKNRQYRCPKCNHSFTKFKGEGSTSLYSRTVDHIIPVWVCRKYGLEQLEMDPRNFTTLCAKCNTERGGIEISIETLTVPDPVKAKLLQIAEKKGLTTKIG